MAALAIDDKTACTILKKAFKILSKQCNVEITLEQYGSGTVCIVSEDREIAAVNKPNNKYNLLYFSSGTSLLETLMDKNVTLSFNPFTFDKKCIINFSKIFGSTIEEVKINLDLNKV